MTLELYRRKPFLFKITTLWVLFCFSTQTLSWAGWDLSGASVLGSSNQLATNSLAKLLRLQIPPGLGSVRETFLPSDFASHRSPRLIVHIQDAHGVSEAQRHMEQILNDLTGQYGFKRLFVEGAVGRLDPRRFDFFNSRNLTKKVWARLFEEGILNAADLHLLKSSRKIQVSGIENEEVYIRNLELFQKVMSARETSLRWLQLIRESADRLVSLVLNKEGREFLMDWYHFEKGEKRLLDYFRNLRKQARSLADIALEDRKLRMTWPFLTRLAALEDEEKNLDSERISQEKESFLARLKEERIRVELLSRFENLDRENNLRSLFEKLFEALGSHSFSFVPYSHFIAWARCLILRQEIQPEKLSEEIETLTEDIFRRIAKTEKEKLVISIFQRLVLLQKMFQLELSFPEWERVKAEDRLSPEKLIQDLEGFVNQGDIESFQTIFEWAKEFYETAQKRDQILFENTLSAMKNEGVDKAILITGGFHGEGLKARLKREGVAFLEIQPVMTQETSHQTYLDRMLELNLPSIHSHLAPGDDHFPEPSRSQLAAPDALQDEATLAKQGALALVNAHVREAIHQVAPKAPPSRGFVGASLGKRKMKDSLTIRPFGKVMIPEEYRDLIGDPASVIVAQAKTEFNQVWQWLLEARIVVLRGDFHDAHKLYSLLSLKTKKFDWLNKHDFRSRLMVVAHGDKFVGIHNAPQLNHLIDKLEGDTSHLPRHLFLIPVSKVLSIAKTEGRELHVRALNAKIDLLYNVFAPTAQEAVDLMAEHLNIQEGEEVLDMGTGSGVLALLAGKTVRERNLKKVKIIATDVNRWAVENAKRNVGKFGFQDQIEVLGPGNLFDTVEGLKFDWILFNAPWIFRKPKRMLDRARYDEDFATLRQFIAEGQSHLKRGGRILLEYSNLSESAVYPDKHNLESWLAQHGLVISQVWQKKRSPPRSVRKGQNEKRRWRPVNETLYLYEIRAASLGDSDTEKFLGWIEEEFFKEGAFEKKKIEIKQRLKGHPEWFPNRKEPDFYNIFSLMEEKPKEKGKEPLLSPQVIEILQARTLQGAPVDRLWFDLQERFLHSYFRLHQSWMGKGRTKEKELDRISQILTELVYYIHVSSLVIALQADLVSAANRQDAEKLASVSSLLEKLDRLIREDSRHGNNAFTKVTASLPELSLLAMSDFVGAERSDDWFQRKMGANKQEGDMSLYRTGQKVMDRIKKAGGRTREPASILVGQLNQAADVTMFWPEHLYEEMLPLEFLALFHHLDYQVAQQWILPYETSLSWVEGLNDLDLRLIAVKVGLLLDLARSGNPWAKAAVGMFLLLMPHIFLEGKKNRRSPMKEYMEHVKLPDEPLVDIEGYREGILSGLDFLRSYQGLGNMVVWMEFNFQLVYFQAMSYHQNQGRKGTWVRLRDVLLRNRHFKRWWNREPLRRLVSRQRDHRRQQIELLNRSLKHRGLPPLELTAGQMQPSARSLGKTKTESRVKAFGETIVRQHPEWIRRSSKAQRKEEKGSSLGVANSASRLPSMVESEKETKGRSEFLKGSSRGRRRFNGTFSFFRDISQWLNQMQLKQQLQTTSEERPWLYPFQYLPFLSVVFASIDSGRRKKAIKLTPIPMTSNTILNKGDNSINSLLAIPAPVNTGIVLSSIFPSSYLRRGVNIFEFLGVESVIAEIFGLVNKKMLKDKINLDTKLEIRQPKALSLGDESSPNYDVLRMRYSDELHELARAMAEEMPGPLTEASVLERMEKEGVVEPILRLYSYAKYGDGPPQVNRYLIFTFKGHLEASFTKSWTEGIWFKNIKDFIERFEHFKSLYAGYFDEEGLSFYEQYKLFEWETLMGKLARNKDFENEFGPDRYLDGFRLGRDLRDYTVGLKFNPKDRIHRIAFFTFVLEQLREKAAHTTSGAYYTKQDEILTSLASGDINLEKLFMELMPSSLQWFPSDLLMALIAQHLENEKAGPGDKSFSMDELLRQRTHEPGSLEKTSEMDMFAQQAYLFLTLISKYKVKGIHWGKEFAEQSRRFLNLPEVRALTQNGDPDQDWRKEFSADEDKFFEAIGTRRTAFIRSSKGLFRLFQLFPEATTQWIKLRLKKEYEGGILENTLEKLKDPFVLDLLDFIAEEKEIRARFQTYPSPDLIDFFVSLPDLDRGEDELFLISMEPEYILSLYERTRQLKNGGGLNFRDQETQYALFILAHQADQDWKLEDLEKGLRNMFAFRNPKMNEVMNQFLIHANLTNRLGVIEEFEAGPLAVSDAVQEEFVRLFGEAQGNPEQESRLVHTLLIYRWIKMRSKSVKREIRSVINEPHTTSFILEALDENRTESWREFFTDPLSLRPTPSFQDVLRNRGPSFSIVVDAPLTGDKRLMVVSSLFPLGGASDMIRSVVEIDANGEAKALRTDSFSQMNLQKAHQEGVSNVITYLGKDLAPADQEALKRYFNVFLTYSTGSFSVVFDRGNFAFQNLKAKVSKDEILKEVRERLESGADIKAYLLEVLKPAMDELLTLGLYRLDLLTESEQKDFLLQVILNALFSPIPLASLSGDAILDFTREPLLTEEDRSPSFSKLLEIRDRVLTGRLRLNSLLDRAVHYSVIHRAMSEAGAKKPISFLDYEWRVKLMNEYLKEHPEYVAQFWVDMEGGKYLGPIYDEEVEKEKVFEDKAEFFRVVKEIIERKTDTQYLAGVFTKYPVLVNALYWTRGWRDITVKAQGRIVHAKGYVDLERLWALQSQTYTDYLAVTQLRFETSQEVDKTYLTEDEKHLLKQHSDLAGQAVLDPEGILSKENRWALLLDIEAYVKRRMYLKQTRPKDQSAKLITVDEITRVARHMIREMLEGKLSLSEQDITERLLTQYDRKDVVEGMYAIFSQRLFRAVQRKEGEKLVGFYRKVLAKIAVAFPMIEDENLRVRFALTQFELESQTDDDLLSLLEVQNTLFTDRQKHLLDRIGIAGYQKQVKAQVLSRGKGFRELLKSIEVKLSKTEETRHFVMTRGPLAFFRGDIAVDCSNSILELEHGAPLIHTLDWNNLYWIGEGGYAGAYDLGFTLELEGERAEEKIKILGLDTINRIPSYLVPQLVEEIERQALHEHGYLGIALPKVLGSSFNYQGAKTVLGRMNRYRTGPVFHGEPRFREAKEMIDKEKNPDKHHAINLEGGDFIFLIPDSSLLSSSQREQLKRFLKQLAANEMPDSQGLEAIHQTLGLLETSAAGSHANSFKGRDTTGSSMGMEELFLVVRFMERIQRREPLSSTRWLSSDTERLQELIRYPYPRLYFRQAIGVADPAPEDVLSFYDVQRDEMNDTHWERLERVLAQLFDFLMEKYRTETDQFLESLDEINRSAKQLTIVAGIFLKLRGLFPIGIDALRDVTLFPRLQPEKVLGFLTEVKQALRDLYALGINIDRIIDVGKKVSSVEFKLEWNLPIRREEMEGLAYQVRALVLPDRDSDNAQSLGEKKRGPDEPEGLTPARQVMADAEGQSVAQSLGNASRGEGRETHAQSLGAVDEKITLWGEKAKEIMKLPLTAQTEAVRLLLGFMSITAGSKVMADELNVLPYDFQPYESRPDHGYVLRRHLTVLDVLRGIGLYLLYKSSIAENGKHFSLHDFAYVEELIRAYNQQEGIRMPLDIPSLFHYSRSHVFTSNETFMEFSKQLTRLPREYAVKTVALESFLKAIHLDGPEKSDTHHEIEVINNLLRFSFEALEQPGLAPSDERVLKMGLTRLLIFLLPFFASDLGRANVDKVLKIRGEIPESVEKEFVDLITSKLDTIEKILGDFEYQRIAPSEESVDILKDDFFLSGFFWLYYIQAEPFLLENLPPSKYPITELFLNRDNPETVAYMNQMVNDLVKRHREHMERLALGEELEDLPAHYFHRFFFQTGGQVMDQIQMSRSIVAAVKAGIQAQHDDRPSSHPASLGAKEPVNRDKALHDFWMLLTQEKDIFDIDSEHPDSHKLELLTRAIQPLFQSHGLLALRPVLIPANPIFGNLMKDRNTRLIYTDENIMRLLTDAAAKDPMIQSVYPILHMALEAPVENVIQHGNGGAVFIFRGDQAGKYILAVLDQGPGMDLSSWLAGKTSPAGDLHWGLRSLVDSVPQHVDQLSIRSRGYEYDIPDWKGLIPRNDIPEQGTLVVMEVSYPAASLGISHSVELEIPVQDRAMKVSFPAKAVDILQSRGESSSPWAEVMTVIYVAGGFVRPDYPEPIGTLIAEGIEPILSILEGRSQERFRAQDPAIAAANQNIQWIFKLPFFKERSVPIPSAKNIAKNLALLLDVQVLERSTKGEISQLADRLEKGDLVLAFWNGEGQGAWNREKPKALSNLIKAMIPKGIRVTDVSSRHPSLQEVRRKLPTHYGRGILINGSKGSYGNLEVSIELDRFKFDTEILNASGFNTNQAIALLRQIADVADPVRRSQLYRYVLGENSFDAVSNSWTVGQGLIDFVKEQYRAREVLERAA